MVLYVRGFYFSKQEHKRYGSMPFNRGTVGYGFAENARPYNRGNASNARPSAAAMARVKIAVFTKTAVKKQRKHNDIFLKKTRFLLAI